MLQVKSVTFSRYNESFLKLAKRLDLEKFSLNSQFFVEASNLVNEYNQVAGSGKPIKEKLKDMKNHIKRFFDTCIMCTFV